MPKSYVIVVFAHGINNIERVIGFFECVEDAEDYAAETQQISQIHEADEVLYVIEEVESP